VTKLANGPLGGIEQVRQPTVGEALALEFAQQRLGEIAEGLFLEGQFDVNNLFNLNQEPRVDVGQGMDFIDRETTGKCIAHIPNSLGAGLSQFLFNGLAVGGLLIESIDPHLQAPQRLLEGLLKGSAHGHDLAHRLHLCGQVAIGRWEFLEGKARNLRDHVVNGRFEGGRCGARSDFIAQFIEGIAHGQFGSHLCNGKACGLRCQGRRTRDPGVHLDDDHAAVVGVDCKLNIRAAGVHANLTKDRDRCVAHDLVLLVGEGLCRGHRDGVPRVNAHGVEVLDGTDNDAVVGSVSNHLHLKFFPTDERLFNEQLAGG